MDFERIRFARTPKCADGCGGILDVDEVTGKRNFWRLIMAGLKVETVEKLRLLKEMKQRCVRKSENKMWRKEFRYPLTAAFFESD
jgi:hypothetical protein